MEYDLNIPVIRYFNDLTKIYRPSKGEQAVDDYLMAFAESQGLKARTDAIGNVFIDKPASPGCQQRAPLILQAHIDMITVKDSGSRFDFAKEPLRLQVKDGWLSAQGTTLGADDGLGVAYILALLADPKAVHPPLQCILTAREEIGMAGALKLQKKDIKADRMISLDGSGEYTTIVSCAGGLTVKAVKPVRFQTNKEPSYRLSISKLLGGHSGIDIARPRANAGKLAGRLLAELQAAAFGIGLVSLTGGSQVNAIMDSCQIVFTCRQPAEKLQAFIGRWHDMIAREITGEPDLAIELEPVKTNKRMAPADSRQIIEMLYLWPDGMTVYDPKARQAVTSSNLGVMKTGSDRFQLGCRIRSIHDSAIDDLFTRMKLTGAKYNAAVTGSGRYPGWRYHPDSPMRHSLKQAVRQVTGKRLVEQVTHGGIECGVFASLNPRMDAVNFGPLVEGCHTTSEKLNLESFVKTYRTLCLLVELCQ